MIGENSDVFDTITYRHEIIPLDKLIYRVYYFQW